MIRSQIHIDQHLSNVALGYRRMGFIADQIYPVVEVPKETDLYVVWDQGDMFRSENDKRGRGDEAHKIHIRASSDGYVCKNYALKADVTIEERANADPIFLQKFESGRVMVVTDKLQLNWDVRVANQISSTSNVGSSAAVASAWTDYTNADPLADLNTGIDNVEDATGYRPNRVLFSGTAWRHFRRNKNVIDKATNPNVTGGGNYPGVREIEELLEARVVVAQGYHNTAEEAIAQALTRTFGDHAWVYYAPERPSMELPSFGYSFRWVRPGLPNFQAERHPYDSRRHCDEVEVGYYQDEKITASALCFMVTNTTSST